MDDSIKKHLYDIATVIEEIDSFFGGRPKVFYEFCNNLCLRRAVERNIEIIGKQPIGSFNPNRSLDTPCPFLIGKIRLSGILPASGRILFPATPRRSPLRLRPARSMLHGTGEQSPQCLMTDLG